MKQDREQMLTYGIFSTSGCLGSQDRLWLGFAAKFTGALMLNYISCCKNDCNVDADRVDTISCSSLLPNSCDSSQGQCMSSGCTREAAAVLLLYVPSRMWLLLHLLRWAF